MDRIQKFTEFVKNINEGRSVISFLQFIEKGRNAIKQSSI